MTRQIHLNGFEMNTVSHISHGLWTHPENERERYLDIEYWLETARLLERGLFDAIFLADVLGTSNVYGGSRDAAVERGIQIPNNDPFLVIPAMLAVTEHLGMAVTVSTTYEQPYANARRLSTLDHLSKGRLAWNVVTGYLPDAALNAGAAERGASADRYGIADEFLDVSYQLWEGSWEDDAVVRDRERRVYAEPSKVHEVRHDGTYFQVAGPHLSEPSRQRTPVIFQAGTSAAGKDFAARHAEAVFVASQTERDVADYVSDLRGRAEAAGRGRDAHRVFLQVNLIIGESEEDAARKKADLLSHRDVVGYLVHHSGIAGVDLSAAAAGTIDLENVAGHSQGYLAQITDRGRLHASQVLDVLSDPEQDEFLIVGTAAQVADRLQEIQEHTDVDGFNVVQYVSPGSFRDVVELLVPELQARGAYRTAYEPGETLRERLFPGGGPRLPETHPAAAHRRITTTAVEAVEAADAGAAGAADV
ncbi:NtaA/DmoA family FMN-dependent monooxygenase [Plantibacter sp. YIM 135249]|uniref:NtaA/DmoA family FMN-dependent monooxygenase n=1 Tax=Plantibacter sp. YIM 135249 TaxID=3423918 RepID=UPI003D350924